MATTLTGNWSSSTSKEVLNALLPCSSVDVVKRRKRQSEEPALDLPKTKTTSKYFKIVKKELYLFWIGKGLFWPTSLQPLERVYFGTHLCNHFQNQTSHLLLLISVSGKRFQTILYSDTNFLKLVIEILMRRTGKKDVVTDSFLSRMTQTRFISFGY